MTKYSNALSTIEDITYQSLQYEFHHNHWAGIISTTIDLSKILTNHGWWTDDVDVLKMIKSGVEIVKNKRLSFNMNWVTIRPQWKLSYYIAINTFDKESYQSPFPKILEDNIFSDKEKKHQAHEVWSNNVNNHIA